MHQTFEELQKQFYDHIVPEEHKRVVHEAREKRFGRCWFTKAGQIIPVRFMKDDHLINAYNMLYKGSLQVDDLVKAIEDQGFRVFTPAENKQHLYFRCYESMSALSNVMEIRQVVYDRALMDEVHDKAEENERIMLAEWEW